MFSRVASLLPAYKMAPSPPRPRSDFNLQPDAGGPLGGLLARCTELAEVNFEGNEALFTPAGLEALVGGLGEATLAWTKLNLCAGQGGRGGIV